jgi:tripeptidyl-peptidase-1
MESIHQLRSRNDIRKMERMASDFVHEVTFVIRQSNISVLTAFLNDVSDPASVNYGRHMTKQEVADMTSNYEARGAVVSHLILSGATIVAETLHGEYITANASVSVWESMFNTQFFMFHQSENNKLMKKVVRAESYSIPSSLHPYVDGVFNTIQMPPHIGAAVIPFRDKTVVEEIALAATESMTPAKLRKFYNVGDTKGSSLSTQAIFATIKQYFSPADLTAFQTDVGLPLQAVATSIGGYSSDTICIKDPDTCAEGNLDVQYIMAMSPVSPTTYWYTDEDWSKWLISVANTPNPPLVFSISYGQEETYVTKVIKDAFNTAAIKLGAMGVTIVASSGDDGAVSRATRIFGREGCYYAPLFPASNPYVTAVGATSVSKAMHFQ